MKWDRKNKARFQKLIYSKFCSMADQILKNQECKSNIERRRKEFLRQFEIRRVRLDSSGTWVYYYTLRNAKSADRVIILDPWYGRTGHGVGLSVPKDIAEKFLVLGIP